MTKQTQRKIENAAVELWSAMRVARSERSHELQSAMAALASAMGSALAGALTSGPSTNCVAVVVGAWRAVEEIREGRLDFAVADALLVLRAADQLCIALDSQSVRIGEVSDAAGQWFVALRQARPLPSMGAWGAL